jgi:8-oxo-dGTP diphosphatase
LVKVTAAIIFKDGKLLIAQRPSGDPLEYKWELPGGKIEVNETPEECLTRELYEEFNIKVSVGDLFMVSEHQYNDILVELMAYNTEWLEGYFHNLFHKSIIFVSIGELVNFEFAEADKPIIENIIKSYL